MTTRRHIEHDGNFTPTLLSGLMKLDSEHGPQMHATCWPHHVTLAYEYKNLDAAKAAAKKWLREEQTGFVVDA